LIKKHILIAQNKEKSVLFADIIQSKKIREAQITADEVLKDVDSLKGRFDGTIDITLKPLENKKNKVYKKEWTVSAFSIGGGYYKAWHPYIEGDKLVARDPYRVLRNASIIYFIAYITYLALMNIANSLKLQKAEGDINILFIVLGFIFSLGSTLSKSNISKIKHLTQRKICYLHIFIEIPTVIALYISISKAKSTYSIDTKAVTLIIIVALAFIITKIIVSINSDREKLHLSKIK